MLFRSGVVVGLAGTGDGNSGLTLQSLQSMVSQFGLVTDAASLNAKNVAAVMVTAEMPAFMKPGQRLDVTVSTVGGSKSLRGGTLLMTPMLGADGETYAIAQGNLTIRVTETAQVSQPLPFSNTGTTTTVPRTEIEVQENGDRKLTVLEKGVSLQDLVNGLNALGIGPRDMITILQAIKAAGALNADIEVL